MPFCIRRSIIILWTVCVLVLPNTVHARYFNPNNVLTDTELTNRDALSRASIQLFLEKKGSALASYTQLWNGALKKASEIIWLIGQEYGVNPKFLLAKLQHEQGLIEKTTATDKALDWATGYSCYARGCNEKYRGFGQQLDATASTQIIYSQNPGRFKFKIGVPTTTTDGMLVTPENQATANLYIYTPYEGGKNNIGGIYFFSRIWDRYFTDRQFPDGATVRDEQGNYYMVDKGKKRMFDSEATYLSHYSSSDYFTSTQVALSVYPDGPQITSSSFLTEARFTKYTTADTTPGASPDAVVGTVMKDGTIFKNSTGDTFIISNGERHRFANITTAARVFGQAKIDQAPVWSDEQIMLTAAGDPIEYIDASFKDGDEAQKALLAVYESEHIPGSWKVGQAQSGAVAFRNVGALNWKPGEIWLTVKSTGDKIQLTQEILSGQVALFNVNFPASKDPKLVDEFFILENKDGPISGGLIIKTYSINADAQASIVSDTLPEIVSNLKKPVRVEIKVKNTGTIAWNPRRTALIVKNTVNKKIRSAMYDGGDWIRTDVAATPVERKTIAPGATATFRFTLDGRGIEPGNYSQDFSITLTDKNKTVWLNYSQAYTVDMSITGKSYKKPPKLKKK